MDKTILGKNGDFWLYLCLGLVFISVAFILLSIAYLPFVVLVLGISDYEFTQADTARALFCLLLSVALFIPPVWAWVRLMHKRSLRSLISPHGHSAKSALKMSVVFFGLYFFLGEVASAFIPSVETQYVWQPVTWFIWIIPIAIATFLQTSAEEILFRGYFQQYLAALIPYRIVYFLVPTLIWVSMHFGNIDGYYTNFAALFSVFVLGIIFADWADRTKSLWGPMIVHFLNNFVLICLFGNSLEKSDMHILRNNFDSLSDPTIAVLTVLGAGLMAGTYIVLRPRIHE